MPTDFGTQVVTAAGTREPLTNDIANNYVRASSNVTAITFIAPDTNTGKVYVGRDGVSAAYGPPLNPGDAMEMSDISERFGNFNVDSATSGDAVTWIVTFTSAQRSS